MPKAKVKPMFVLVDGANGVCVGPFASEADAARYAKMNEWGPREPVSRMDDGWAVWAFSYPDEATDGSYRLVFD
jgi:hypothetical protein